ncbi:uncharacterized protein [Nicotiana tomentosiformis]|uniref:uncharacterized protein n=1 Tax=Nicotiana tomentosiformis TaxID=4098 RepID=UPI00388CE285
MAFSLSTNDGMLRYQGRLCVPNIDGLQVRIMTEDYSSKYFVHTGSMKMYHDLKEVYRWNDMKKDVADFVARFPNCQQVKAEHQKPDDLAHNIEFPMWKWEMINMNFVVVKEEEFIGLDHVHQAMEKVKIVKVWLKTAQSRQKSYSNVRRIDLEFKEDDWRVGQVAYRLELPPEMSLVHSVFHVSMLKKVVGDPSLIVQVEAIEVNEELTYEKILVAILDRQVWKLRNKEISSIKVILRYQQVEEATWEAEEEMKR